ncbi:MAG: citrate lyase acyl carrier protein [Candidatus Kapabacteria bacterium]|nr:citrate lyase acyl carrier protein [Candidatus Kapabacteria bacterium]
MKTAFAGTGESGDIYIEVSPAAAKSGVEVNLNSTVGSQFGNQIKKVILQTLEELKISDVAINANDKGALDCTIRARVTAAVCRATGEDIWGK